MSTALARNTDPHTSKTAASRLHTRRTLMLQLLEPFCDAFPKAMIAADAVTRAGNPDGGWKRVSDLKNEGLIAPVLGPDDVPLTEMGPNGRQCVLLKATGKGLSVRGGML